MCVVAIGGGRAMRAAAGVRLPHKAFVRADAAMRYCSLWDSEQQAGEMLRLAGFSPGTGVCARGGPAGGNSEWGCRR